MTDEEGSAVGPGVSLRVVQVVVALEVGSETSTGVVELATSLVDSAVVDEAAAVGAVATLT
jgi:hypothetical protein